LKKYKIITKEKETVLQVMDFKFDNRKWEVQK